MMWVERTMVPLPEDLSRLGDELTAAAGRTLDERRRRRRLLARGGASALAGVLAIAVLAPAALSPGLESAPPLASEAMRAVLVRPPDRRPVLVAREVPASDGVVLVRPPDRRPPLPVVVRRDA
jgi:DMSO/TMAO reductase YedYZ molybdopterin-dependent catalytic subunit